MKKIAALRRQPKSPPRTRRAQDPFAPGFAPVAPAFSPSPFSPARASPLPLVSPRAAPGLAPVASAAGSPAPGFAPVASAAGSPSRARPSLALSASPSGQGASAGPTANVVVPTENGANASRICGSSPFTSVTASAATSSSNARGGSEPSAITTSQSSPEPTETRSPSVSATSAPRIGPSTIFRMKLIFFYTFSRPSGWMLISLESSWKLRTGSS